MKIRKATKRDAEGIRDLFNEVTKNGFNKYMGTNKPWNKKRFNRFKIFLLKKTSINVVASNKEGKIIGSCSFDSSGKGRTRHRGELGWVVHNNYAKKGVATKMLKLIIEEAKKKGYKKLEAEAAIPNVASKKLAEKLGFKIEGRKKSGLILDNGKYVDTYIFGKVLK